MNEPCPRCGSTQTVPIVYGLPDPQRVPLEDVEAGKVILGGCLVSGKEGGRHCRRCGFEWSALTAFAGALDSASSSVTLAYVGMDHLIAPGRRGRWRHRRRMGEQLVQGQGSEEGAG